MAIELPLTPERERQLQDEARSAGSPVGEYIVRRLLGTKLMRSPTARELLAMPFDQRERYLAAAAEDAAPLYSEDLALPSSERELTAFTALDREPFREEE